MVNCVNYKQEEEDKTEGLFQKFKESEVAITNDVTETKLFVDIEEEQEKRKERQEVSPRDINTSSGHCATVQEEAMAVSPDESFEVVEGEDSSCHSNISDNIPEETGDGVKRSFCCQKHKALFMTSTNSIRS